MHMMLSGLQAGGRWGEGAAPPEATCRQDAKKERNVRRKVHWAHASLSKVLREAWSFCPHCGKKRATVSRPKASVPDRFSTERVEGGSEVDLEVTRPMLAAKRPHVLNGAAGHRVASVVWDLGKHQRQ